MEEAVIALAAVAVLLVLVAALFAVRRFSLTRPRGSFDCSFRPQDGRWVVGVARYGRDSLEWWRVFSLAPRPHRSWSRCDLEVRHRREPGPGEADALHVRALVVGCVERGSPLELAMSPEAYTGFASWLESSPPRARGQVT